jgi:hypothetical protein
MEGKIGRNMREQDAKARGTAIFGLCNSRQNVQGDENNLLKYDIDNFPIYKHWPATTLTSSWCRLET